MTRTIKLESIAYLDAMQRSILDSCSANPAVLRMRFRQGRVFNADDLQYIIRFPLSDIEEEQLRLDDPFFTTFEDDATKRILWFLLNRSNIAFRLISRTLPDDIVIGTVPLGSVNACIFKAPSGGTIITLNNGIIPFLAAISEFTTSCTIPGFHNGQTTFRFPDLDEVHALLDRETKLSERFARVFRNYCVVGGCDGESGYISADSERGSVHFTNLLIQTALLFLVCHELSHLLLGHLPPPENERGSQDDVVPAAWLREHLCDALACSAVLSYNRKLVESHVEASFLGISIFFFSLDILGRLIPRINASTHPPPLQRFKVLFDRLQEESGSQIAGTFIAGVSNTLYALWDRNENQLKEELANPMVPEDYVSSLILLNPALRQYIPKSLQTSLESQSRIDELLPQRIAD